MVLCLEQAQAPGKKGEGKRGKGAKGLKKQGKSFKAAAAGVSQRRRDRPYGRGADRVGGWPKVWDSPALSSIWPGVQCCDNFSIWTLRV